MDGSQVQPGRQDHPDLHQRVVDPTDRLVFRRDAKDLHRSPELQEHPLGGVVLPGLSIRHFGIH